MKERIFGIGHRILTALGAVAGALVFLGQYLDYIPAEYRSSKWYAVAVALVALGAALKMPAKPPAIAVVPDPPKGFAHPALLLALAVALGMFAFSARAEEPKFGGCLTSHPGTCFAPSVSVNVIAIRVNDGSVTSTFDPGIGYGASVFSDKWHKLGLSATFSFPTYAAGRRIQPAAIFSFAEYGRFGVACPMWVAGGFRENAQILLGFGSDFGRW